MGKRERRADSSVATLGLGKMAATYDGTNLYWRGHGTFRVTQGLHQANREKAMRHVRQISGNEKGVCLLKGGRDTCRHNTDHEDLFRQESFFHYLFGVEEPDCCGIIDVETCRTTLFVPKLPEHFAVWMGTIPSLDVFKSKYGVDSVLYTESLCTEITRIAPQCIHLLQGSNTDSGLLMQRPDFGDDLKDHKVVDDVLYRALCESRCTKTPEEIEVMRYVSKISSEAHVEVMRSCKPGMMEYQLESIFLHKAYFNGGCRFAPYTAIIGAGEHGAFLHYGHSGAPNACEIPDNALVLCDMGGEYHGYAADITCTFPSSGRFSEDQAVVYNAVLAAHTRVIAEMKPGVSWLGMHTLAERVIIEGLKTGGFVVGDVGEMMAANLGSIFMPHGLGHLLGIDTHDVGGYGKGYPPRPERSGANKLRMARVLEEGMVVTVEPGCYLNKYLITKALKDETFARFLNAAKLEANMDMGGVRIEDNVLVTKDGSDSFTNVPRTVEEIEALMAGK